MLILKEVWYKKWNGLINNAHNNNAQSEIDLQYEAILDHRIYRATRWFESWGYFNKT